MTRRRSRSPPAAPNRDPPLDARTDAADQDSSLPPTARITRPAAAGWQISQGKPSTCSRRSPTIAASRTGWRRRPVRATTARWVFRRAAYRINGLLMLFAAGN